MEGTPPWGRGLQLVEDVATAHWMVKSLESHMPRLEGRKLPAMGGEDTMRLPGERPTEMPVNTH